MCKKNGTARKWGKLVEADFSSSFSLDRSRKLVGKLGPDRSGVIATITLVSSPSSASLLNRFFISGISFRNWVPWLDDDLVYSLIPLTNMVSPNRAVTEVVTAICEVIKLSEKELDNPTGASRRADLVTAIFKLTVFSSITVGVIATDTPIGIWRNEPASPPEVPRVTFAPAVKVAGILSIATKVGLDITFVSIVVEFAMFSAYEIKLFVCDDPRVKAKERVLEKTPSVLTVLIAPVAKTLRDDSKSTPVEVLLFVVVDMMTVSKKTDVGGGAPGQGLGIVGEGVTEEDEDSVEELDESSESDLFLVLVERKPGFWSQSNQCRTVLSSFSFLVLDLVEAAGIDFFRSVEILFSCLLDNEGPSRINTLTLFSKSSSIFFE